MSKIKFELNSEGVRELLRSSEMANICREYAEAVQGRAGGDGYEVTTHTGKNRVNASVHAVSDEALHDVYNENSLVKALHG